MATALSVDTFAELVQRSRLLSAEQVQQVLQELEAEGTHVDTPEALADALVRRELLTSWQVGFLLKGKHNGFFLGSYRFLKMLGKGGMGAVYLAEHQMMRRRCAIKVLPTKLISETSSVLDRFYLEAQAVAALDDPNIVRAYDVNKEMQGTREIHYLVMEYVDGCDLQVLVQRKGPLDYVQVADFARQAASGLAHAHECGLIHRDIKPANLLIDERDTVKILDLGLARFFDDRLDASLTTTHNESILGTADYLSPEQALDSHNVDTRTDIYSLGCTCYFMLTGHPPFPEGSVAQRLMSHQAKSPTAIEKIRADAPADLVTIVEKMIAKSADNRYQSAREVADAFTAWLTEHAGEDWKKAHRHIAEGSGSHASHQLTRAKSAATEETSLELGLAPTEELGLAPTEELGLAPMEEEKVAPAVAAASQVTERDAPTDTSEAALGLDQLEVLNPLPTAFDSGTSSDGLDSLLNEALDNYPALDSNPNLAAYSAQPAMGSGVHPAATPAPAVAGESNQLLRLILIGFAVSVPLSIVILVVASNSSTPAGSEAGAGSTLPPTVQAPPPGVGLANAPPVDDVAQPGRTENAPPTEAANAGTPTAMPKEEPTPAPAEPEKVEPPKTPPAKATTTKKTPIEDAATDSEASPDSSNVPPEPSPNTTPSKIAPPATRDVNRDDSSGTSGSEPAPPSAERVRKLFAGLSAVALTLDRPPNRKTYAYDLMVLKAAQESLERSKLKVNAVSEGGSKAVMTLTFDSERAGGGYLFHVGAELKCREGDEEVVVWKQLEDVGPISANALGPTPPSPLRNKVTDFFNNFGKDFRHARDHE